MSHGGRAMTVLGTVPVEKLGTTLFHEHLHMDASKLLAVHGYEAQADRPFDAAAAAEARWDPGSHPDNYRFTEDDLVALEVGRFRNAGGATIVEQTPPALDRDPLALQEISRASGVNVVMGTGHYLAPTHAEWVAQVTDIELCHRLSLECRDGEPETGVRPGIIGELGTSIPVHPQEVRVLRAAACAALETGLSVSVHLHPWGRTGSEVIDVLLAEGLPPERIALGHLNTAWDDEPYLRELADREVSLVFDLFGFDHSLLGVGRWAPADLDVARAVAHLVSSGYREQVLISHDIGVRSRLVAYGSWGYAHIPRHIVPMLMRLGLGEDDIEQLLVTNPARLLTVEGL
ncbi:MAG: phosphotriesterase [Chloroflexota bacterium]